MTAYETVSAGSKGAANLLEHQRYCFRLRQLVVSSKCKKFHYWSLQAPDEESDEVIIHRIYFSEYPFQFYNIVAKLNITQHSSGLVVTKTLPELNCGEI